jgi:hypothetical protein
LLAAFRERYVDGVAPESMMDAIERAGGRSLVT